MFGTQKVEEMQYAKALKAVSQTGLSLRHSFSYLKLFQCVMLAFGSAAVTFVTYHEHMYSQLL